MKKFILQGLLSIGLFFAMWFMLLQIDWLSVFKIEKIENKTEEKLGDLFFEIFQKSEKEIKDTFVLNTIDSLVSKICFANQLERSEIKIHIFQKEDINAFALPNGHLIVFSALISNSESQEELSGVLCHEIAHIRLNHVIKKLLKEIGLSILISMTTGKSSSEKIKQGIKMLSSTAFDRALEKEADKKAVEYLQTASLDPKPFANFLYQLSEIENHTNKYFTWMSTHPDSKERAKNILEYAKHQTFAYNNILSKETWSRLKTSLKN